MAARSAPAPAPPPTFAGECECWACGTTVRVPCAASGSGTPAPAFFCGWCRAVNGTIPRARGGGPPVGRLIHTALRSAGRAFPVLSLTVIAVAVVAGVGWILPALFGGDGRALFLSNLAAAAASFHIFLHFGASAASRPAGPAVALHPRGSVPAGAYEGHMQCGPCGGSHKPPGTHHCAACGVCVPDHDHHCFFTGGCVSGAAGGNARHFLLMLAWILVGTGYGLMASAALAWRRREEVGALLRGALAAAAGSEAGSLLAPPPRAGLAARLAGLVRGGASPPPPPPRPSASSLALYPTMSVARLLLKAAAAVLRVAGGAKPGGPAARAAAQTAAAAHALAAAAALPAAALAGPPWFLALVTLAGICGAAFLGVAALAVQVLRRLAGGASAADAVRPRLVLVGREGGGGGDGVDTTPPPPGGVRAALGKIFGPGPAWRWVLPPYGRVEEKAD